MKYALLLISVLLAFPASADPLCEWPHWESFKAAYIENGRVIDRSDPRHITTSEGQSYAMFFALVANDRSSFDQVLAWTQRELAGGDLAAYLPAWLWGQRDLAVTSRGGKKYGVLDNNSAADSDLWIAYSLIEAGRLWHHYYYSSLGYLLLEQIRRYEVVEIPKLGLSLLPAPMGFVSDGEFRVNPSYAPLQILDRFATLYPQKNWDKVSASAYKLLLQSMPKGYSPDWVKIPAGSNAANWVLDVGSYDAIRNYLWVGMLADSHPQKPTLISAMKPMADAVEKNDGPPEEINTSTGVYSGTGPAGFSAALLPFLTQYDKKETLIQQRERAAGLLANATENERYYSSVLALFGVGWDQNYFQFSKDGALHTAWQTGCQS